ncbi:MAG: hypothetical protein U9O98_11195, partial [Asgard group archaeon]|nr:hypothetical protein [Asgard group archaeon]
ISIAEKLFVEALKARLKEVYLKKPKQKKVNIARKLNTKGIHSIQKLSDTNPAELAKILQISLDYAGEIVMFAMELGVKENNIAIQSKKKRFVTEFEKELEHKLGELERKEEEEEQLLSKEQVSSSVERINKLIQFPTQHFFLKEEHKSQIKKLLDQFMSVFPACTGFSLYNKESHGIMKIAKDNQADNTITAIHESIPNIFWKISLIMEETDDYGWIKNGPHLVWIEAIRHPQTKRRLEFIGIFIFEAYSEKGVGTATPTIKGIIKEIEHIIYET